MAVYSFLENRSRGIRRYGQIDEIYHSIYSGMTSQKMSTASAAGTPGGIYNLEFSPNGSVLVAACEKKNVQLYDTISCQQYTEIPAAHSDCVNCIKFLDDRLFATCSDDCTVCIWDLRNLKSRVHQLAGHKSWVKNIEYSRRDNLIVTSGLDGSIYTWDIHKSPDGSRYQKVFHTPGLMRCRISSDETKMVICTTGGYLIIVNDLNLNTLAADLKGFRPNIHRLMQLGTQYFPIVSEFKHVFDTRRRRNRVELISDFPENNDAEVVCSLAIHPHNWVALSRNMNADEQSEWTCVHDIQEMTDPYQHQQQKGRLREEGESSAFVEQEDEYDAVKRRVATEFAELRQQVVSHVEKASTPAGRSRAKSYLKKMNRFLTLLGNPEDSTLPLVPSTSLDMWSGQMASDNRFTGSRIGPIRSGLITGTVVEDEDNPEMTSADGIYMSSSDEEEEEEEEDDDEHVHNLAAENDIILQMHVDESTAANPPISSATTSSRTPPAGERFYCFVGNRLGRLINELQAIQKDMNMKYKTNKPRLLYYAQESMAGKGYIKELCFSSDGRVIASPYCNGIRILAFNERCQELCDTVESWQEPQKPRALTEVVKDEKCHSNLVVCTKFSPNYPLLVSGCLEGTIVWHYPKF